MSEQKHTPGPWHVTLEDCFDLHLIGITAGDDVYPCHVESWCAMDSEGREQAAANARLIASAPELHRVASLILENNYRIGLPVEILAELRSVLEE